MKFPEPNLDTVSAIKEAYITLDAANSLFSKAVEQESSKKPALSQLHDYATGKLPFPNQNILQKISAV